MVRFFSRIARPGRKVRGRAAPVRLHLERLEGRDLPAPLTPTGLQAVGVSASAISLTWNAPPDPSVTGYDLYEKVRHVVYQPKGGSRSYYTFDLRASNLTTTSDTLTGLATGSSHTYLVTSVSPAGQSPYSDPAVGRTWIAPSMPYGPSTVLLSNGA